MWTIAMRRNLSIQSPAKVISRQEHSLPNGNLQEKDLEAEAYDTEMQIW